MSYGIALIVLALTAPVMGQDDPSLKVERSAGSNPWTSLKLNNHPGNFQFVIVTDRTGGHRPGVFESAVGKINLLQPEFVISVGDLIEGYTHNVQELDRQWDEFESFTAKLQMPFFYVPGNHDVTNPVQTEKWKERFGRDYYHFVYRDVLFICLNTEDGGHARIGSEQIAHVRKALEENSNARWTLLYMHRPLWITEDRYARTPASEEPTGWLEVESLLRAGGRKFTVFAGHEHDYMKFVRQDRNFIILSTTGGASQLRGPSFGEFDHVVWATMTDDGPVLANLFLDGIWDENVATDVSRARVSALASAARIVAHPLRAGDTPMHAATLPLKITNDADIPLHVSGRFRPSDALKVDPYALEKTIAPNSVETIDLQIEARDSKTPLEDLAPLLLDSTLTYQPDDAPKLSIPRVVSVAVDRVAEVAQREAPATIDGKLDEWKALDHVCEQPMQIRENASSWEGPGDASFRFATAYDDDFVYIAVRATDERVIPMQNPDRPWTQDSLEIRFDARPDPVRSESRGEGDIDNFLFLAICPGETAKDSFLFSADDARMPKGLKVVSLKTDTGYDTEIAIPTRYLNERQKRSWRAFRLNIAMNDRDDIESPRAQLHWRPDWRTEENFAGSGTFQRRDATP